jgi:hypothetical protein
MQDSPADNFPDNFSTTVCPMPAQLKRRLSIFLLIVLLIAGLFAHWFSGAFLRSTDNAYVQGEITRVSSQLGHASTRCWSRTTSTSKRQLLVKLEVMISTWPSTAQTQPSPLAKPNACRPRAN